MIEHLLPEGVAVAVASPQDQHGQVWPQEEVMLLGTGERRRRDITAGRRCARRALAGLGLEGSPVLAAPDRAPIWPAGVVGSITHTRGYCAAVAAFEANVGQLGIDAESVRRLSPEAARLVSLPDEAEAVHRAQLGDHVDAALLLFCCKEAAYKAWYPAAHRPLEFHQMLIRTDASAGTFSAEVLDFAGPPSAPVSYQGRFAITSSHVFAVAAAACRWPSHTAR